MSDRERERERRIDRERERESVAIVSSSLLFVSRDPSWYKVERAGESLMEPAACPKTVTQIGDLSIGKFSIPNGILCNFRLCQLTKHTRTYTQTLTRSTITLPLPTTSLFCAPREQKANIKYTSCVFIVAFKKIKKKLGKFKVDFKHSHRESSRIESSLV